MKGIVLGVYTNKNPNDEKSQREVVDTTDAFKNVDGKTGGALSAILKGTGPFKCSKHKILWTSTLKNHNLEYDCISVVDLGNKEAEDDLLEGINQKSENIRTAIADGVLALGKAAEFKDIDLDPCEIPHCASEGALLAVYSYDELKTKPKHKSNIKVYEFPQMKPETVEDYQIGVILAESQNFARTLMQTPANHMTPTIFAAKVEEKFRNSKVKVIVRDLEWIESMKMGSFLSVSRGSAQPPKFVELHYEGNPGSDKCIAFVGKGITFDSGGISIKHSSDMDKMRADMGGASNVVSTILAASSIGLKINVKGFMPMTENMPSGTATKPGDVVTAMNGKTIQVDNTDAEGRLVLADGLVYAHQFKPVAIIDIATLTGAMIISLGASATGVFTNDDYYWNVLNKAAYGTGDRVWRMPLYKHFSESMTTSDLADMNNMGTGKVKAGACKAAAFLREFVEPGMKWMHLDIAGVMECIGEVNYMPSGMSGRPTRTLVEFLKSLAEEM